MTMVLEAESQFLWVESHLASWHRAPLKPLGQMHRWPWWQVPPFWQMSSSSSQTLAEERERKKTNIKMTIH